MPRLHLPRSSYDLFVYDFLYDFSAAISYDVCVYIAYDHFTISFGAKVEQNFTETLRDTFVYISMSISKFCIFHKV